MWKFVELMSIIRFMLRERLTNNIVAKAFNIDVLGVMTPPEFVVKTLTDGLTLVVVGDSVRELLSQPHLYTVNSAKYAVAAVVCDLILNLANRRYWIARQT